jgi:hypothetical protein
MPEIGRSLRWPRDIPTASNSGYVDVVHFPPDDDVGGVLDEHVRRFFGGRRIDSLAWPAGPIAAANEHFHVLLSPRLIRPRHGCTRPSAVGGGAGEADRGLEFVMATPTETDRAVELPVMTTYDNRTPRLGLGHTIPIGERWFPGSKYDHLLISVP